MSIKRPCPIIYDTDVLSTVRKQLVGKYVQSINDPRMFGEVKSVSVKKRMTGTGAGLKVWHPFRKGFITYGIDRWPELAVISEEQYNENLESHIGDLTHIMIARTSPAGKRLLRESTVTSNP